MVDKRVLDLLDVFWLLYKDGFASSQNKEFTLVDKVKKILKLSLPVSRMAWEWGYNDGAEGRSSISKEKFDALILAGLLGLRKEGQSFNTS
jgi:hypothetical protein